MSIDIARAWLSRHLGGYPVDHFSDDEVRNYVEKAYPGGYAALTDIPAPVTKAPTVPFWQKDRTDFVRTDLPDTPLRKRARAQGLTGWKLPAHAEFVDAKFSDGEVIIHIVVREVTEHARRVRVNREGQSLIRFRRSGSGWRRDEVTIWSDDPSYDQHIFGRIMTPEVAADQRDQYETCWRPGTHRSPRLGPAARAEVSWKEFWADDLPRPPKETKK